MPIKYVDHITMGGLEIQNFKLHPVAADPSGLGAGDEGRAIYNTVSDQVKVWNGSAWVVVGNTDADTLDGQDGTYYLARANHTGTQAPATIAFAATSRILGNSAGTAGEELTVGGGIEFSGASIRTTAFTGDVTKVAGGTALTIANDAVTNAKAANMAVNTIKGRVTAGTGDPEDLTAAQAKTILAIVAADVSDFHTAVRTNRLDQMAAPTASVSFNGQKITGLGTPTADDDAATKAYADGVSQGLDFKESVRAATTANITLSGDQTIDGVVLANGDRVLVKDQTTGSQNGIYIKQSAAWTRATDADTSADVTTGMFVFVSEGTVNADSGWVLATNDPITLGTTALTFTQFSGAGQITAGAGLTKTGNTLDVVGTANRIQVNADSVDISSAYVGQTSITTLGTITTGTWSATTIAANRGGTGQTAYTTGDLLYASGTAALSKLADVATGNALISGGVGVAPSWGKIGLTTHVSGTLPAANGGTGHASYAVGDLLYASGATALSRLADVATGNALLSGGVGVAPSWGKVGLTTHVSGTLPIANGGTGATTAAGARTNLAAAGRYQTLIGNGTNTEFGISSGLGVAPEVQVFEDATGTQVYPSVEQSTTTAGDFTLRFAVAPTTNQYYVVAIG